MSELPMNAATTQCRSI